MVKLETDEHIILEVRKHWFILFGEIALSIILILLPFFLFPILKMIGLEVSVSSVSFLFFLYFLWFLVNWVFIFIFWTNYYLDVWLITNKKIIDIEQHGLFSREISIMHYDRIQDVTFEVHGIIATALNFGDINVQTAATKKKFIIKGVKNPSYVQNKINEILVKKRKA